MTLWRGDSVSEIKNRIKLALSIRNMSPTQLGEKTKIPKSSISQYMSGYAKPKQDRIYAIAQALDVSEAWLMGYDVPMERGTPSASTSTIPPGCEPLPRTVKRPLVGTIACGEPITAEQNIEDYVDVPETVRCDFCLRCKGDSMIDAHIEDGDIVYIRIQPEVEDGEIAAVRIGDEATLKRIFYDGQSITLMPCNSTYRPKTYSGEELNDIHIEGKAVGFTHWF